MGRVEHLVNPSLAITAGNMPASTASPWWSDEAGTGGSGASAVKALLDCSTLATHHEDTVIEAFVAGSAGNGITIRLLGDSPGGGGVSIVVSNGAVTIHYESGVSTVAQVETAIGNLAGASKIIDVKTAGTGATVLTAPGDNFVATPLAGGSDASGQGQGHQVDGFHIDEAVAYVTVSSFNALTSLELLVERNTRADGTGIWGRVEPDLPDSLAIGADMDATGGKTLIKSSTVGQALAIPIKHLEGARRVRIGLRAGSAGALGTAAATMAIEFVQRSVQS
jgi:hypothetical protein